MHIALRGLMLLYSILFLFACGLGEPRSQRATYYIDLYLIEEVTDQEHVEVSRVAIEVARAHARSNSYHFHAWRKRWEQIRTWSFNMRSECARFTFIDLQFKTPYDYRIKVYFPWGTEEPSLELQSCLETQTQEVVTLFKEMGVFKIHVAEPETPEWMREILERGE